MWFYGTEKPKNWLAYGSQAHLNTATLIWVASGSEDAGKQHRCSSASQLPCGEEIKRAMQNTPVKVCSHILRSLAWVNCVWVLI